jgi:uncharacterized protein (DUF2141 family)
MIACLTAALAGDLVVRVTGLDDAGGSVVADLFDRAEGFPTRSELARERATATVIDRVAMLRFEGLPAGTYAISAFHDANANGRVDTWWFGPPKEGLAASNGAKGRFGPPSFADASVVVTEAGATLEIQVDYLFR